MLTAKNQVFKPFFNIYSKMQKEKVNIRDQEAMGSSPVTPTNKVLKLEWFQDFIFVLKSLVAYQSA